MKKFVMLFIVVNFIFTLSQTVCAQQQDQILVEKLTFTEKIQKLYNDFLNSPRVSKSIATIKENWQAFKQWFNNLPGIRNYNDSIYSSQNWKKEMGQMGSEYAPHLKKDSAGVKMLQEGKKEWDKL